MSIQCTQEETTVQAAEQIVTAVPPVDIIENADGFTVVADMPGVAQGGIDVKLDNTTLTIEGLTEPRPEAIARSRAFDRIKYRRAFTLGRGIDHERISAELKQGVLRVQLPKTAQAQPKKIDVHVNN